MKWVERLYEILCGMGKRWWKEILALVTLGSGMKELRITTEVTSNDMDNINGLLD